MLITIGAFDGFHKGHEELFRICRENADGNEWAVVTFWPHPSEYMHRIEHSLFTLKERELLRRVLNIPNMYVLCFDDALMNLSPVDFWHLLRAKIHVSGLVMGSDFHFGRCRSGSAEFLSHLAKSEGLRKIVIADLYDKAKYSSSKVREKIIAGDVEGAREILGCNFFMMSRIIHGNERGRTMSFPTANLALDDGRIIPGYGVYAVGVLVNHEWHCGALSIGNNPTFHDVHETRAEVHILDFAGDIYGGEVIVCFLRKVRDMITFSGKDELMRQIANDTDECRKIFGEVRDDDKKFFERVKEVYYLSKNFIPEIIKLV